MQAAGEDLLAILREALIRKLTTGTSFIEDQELEARILSGRYNSLHAADPFNREALAFGPSEPLEGARHTRLYQGGVAVIDVEGPIYRHAADATSGAVATSRIARELNMALKDDKVRSILFVLDTPGGEAVGMDELAQKIFEAREHKPVETYIEGLGASAGYYLASATQRITGSRLGSLTGSIGVVIGVPMPKQTLKSGEAVIEDGHTGQQYVEIVSSVSPLKRANPSTPEGLLYYYNIVNAAADEFVADVARFRNLAAVDLPKQYGDGGVYPAQSRDKTMSALDMGLIDDVGTFDIVHDRLAREFYVAKGQSGSQSASASGPKQPEAQNGGEDVGRFANALAKVGLGGGDEKPDANAQKQAGQEGLMTRAQLLAQMAGERAALEQKFESKALLFASQTVLGNTQGATAIQEHIAFEMLTAMVDDALYGGSVLFPAPEGEEEVEGTRAEQCRAKYAAWPKHSLADNAVSALRAGRTRGVALEEGKKETVKTSQPANDDGDTGVEAHTDDELLGMVSDGQTAIANRNGNSNARAGS